MVPSRRLIRMPTDKFLLDMQIPGELDRGKLYSGFHLHAVFEAWQKKRKEVVA